MFVDTAYSIWVPSRKVIIPIAALAIGFLFVFLFYYSFIPVQMHWRDIFQPAALRFLTGKSPYDVPMFYNPPWALIPLVPFAVLPTEVGSALISTLTIFAYIFVAYKKNASPLILALFVLSPNALWTTIQVNTEWMIALGFILPPQIGLIFILIKPQIGLPVALWHAVESWRRGGYREVLRVFAPVGLAFAASFLIYGPWFLSSQEIVGASWNRSVWPYALPFGLFLLVKAIRDRKRMFATLSFPLLSPYMGQSSLHLILLDMLDNEREAIAVIAGLWLILLISGKPEIIQILQHP